MNALATVASALIVTGVVLAAIGVKAFPMTVPTITPCGSAVCAMPLDGGERHIWH